MSTTKTVLILGATGNQGRAVLKRLSERKGEDFEVYGLVRNRNEPKAKELLDEGKHWQ
jgi:uncharacterized protein YbjT (DUF2867 family)